MDTFRLKSAARLRCAFTLCMCAEVPRLELRTKISLVIHLSLMSRCLRMLVVKMIERDDIVHRGAGIFRVVLVLHEKPATHCGHDFDGPDCLDSRFRLDIHNAHCSFRS